MKPASLSSFAKEAQPQMTEKQVCARFFLRFRSDERLLQWRKTKEEKSRKAAVSYCGITREASRITTAILITMAEEKKTGRNLIHGPFIDYNDNNNNNNEDKHDHKRKWNKSRAFLSFPPLIYVATRGKNYNEKKKVSLKQKEREGPIHTHTHKKREIVREHSRRRRKSEKQAWSVQKRERGNESTYIYLCTCMTEETLCFFKQTLLATREERKLIHPLNEGSSGLKKTHTHEQVHAAHSKAVAFLWLLS